MTASLALPPAARDQLLETLGTAFENRFDALPFRLLDGQNPLALGIGGNRDLLRAGLGIDDNGLLGDFRGDHPLRVLLLALHDRARF